MVCSMLRACDEKERVRTVQCVLSTGQLGIVELQSACSLPCLLMPTQLAVTFHRLGFLVILFGLQHRVPNFDSLYSDVLLSTIKNSTNSIAQPTP